jgi:hypothetical protein
MFRRPVAGVRLALELPLLHVRIGRHAPKPVALGQLEHRQIQDVEASSAFISSNAFNGPPKPASASAAIGRNQSRVRLPSAWRRHGVPK